MVTNYKIPGLMDVDGIFTFEHDDYCRVYMSSAQSIPNVTGTTLTWDSEHEDPNSMHSTVANTDRITAQSAGWYLACLETEWADNSTGWRVSVISESRNQSTVASDLRVAVQLAESSICGIVYLDVDDYVWGAVYQTSGGALNCNTNSQFWAIKILGTS
jgi:hypothetical protein